LKADWFGYGKTVGSQPSVKRLGAAEGNDVVEVVGENVGDEVGVAVVGALVVTTRTGAN
jgi:hypothetical protein